MQVLPFKLSKLAAGIGSVLWWMAYAPQLQAQPLQITVPIPLASSWPAYGRIAAEQLETRAAAWRAEHPEIAAAWRNSTYEGHAEGGPLSSNLPRNVSAAEPFGGPELSGRLDLCAASGLGCSISANGPNGELQCRYCGEAPDGGPDYPDGHDSEGFPGVAHAFAAAREPFAVDFGTDPEAAPMTAEAAVRYAKPKRVRVRAKPLTVTDIVVGAWYVPKRGNDKTPNLFVAAIDDAGVLYDRRRPDALNVGEVTRVSMTDFLALVARRADA